MLNHDEQNVNTRINKAERENSDTPDCGLASALTPKLGDKGGGCQIGFLPWQIRALGFVRAPTHAGI